MSRHVVGIDLGTTNSVVASVDEAGTVVILPNASRRLRSRPSVVYFEPDGTVVVGEEAVQATAVDPENGVQLIKRAHGHRIPAAGPRPGAHPGVDLRAHPQAAGLRRDRRNGGPERKVSAVITVPAYFGLAEREATYQAGVIAGLDVLELLDEPVAAAAHYGLTSGGDRTVLVYDLGGGTFDTTVLQISGGGVTSASHRRTPFTRRRRCRPASPRPDPGTARGATLAR